MKSEEEITKAHDILVAHILRDINVEIPADVRAMLIHNADVLCWMLNHDHNPTFRNNLNNLIKLAEQAGYELKPKPDHDAFNKGDDKHDP